MDDYWHGSEDYPGPVLYDDFEWWEEELAMMGRHEWTWFDTFLRRMVMLGAVMVVWAVFILLTIIGVRGRL